MITLLYGQPGAGKTTIARELETFHRMTVIDGDGLRGAMSNPGYDFTGRLENIKRAWTVSRWLENTATHTPRIIVALVNPYRELREGYWPDALKVYLEHEPRIREEFWTSDFNPDGYDLKINTTERSISETVRTVYRAMENFPFGPSLAD